MGGYEGANWRDAAGSNLLVYRNWVLTGYVMQPLDNRTLSRLESAVQKSSYVGEGKRLKVTNEVSFAAGRTIEFFLFARQRY